MGIFESVRSYFEYKAQKRAMKRVRRSWLRADKVGLERNVGRARSLSWNGDSRHDELDVYTQALQEHTWILTDEQAASIPPVKKRR